MCSRGIEFARVIGECPNESGLPVVASRKQYAWSSVRFRLRPGSPYDQLKVVPVMGVVNDNEGGGRQRAA